MTPAWSAEFVVSNAQARALIEEQFPQLAPVNVEPLGVGFDNSAFVVNGAYVFRFPRRQIAAPLVETEGRLLPMLAPRLPLPIPAPTLLGRPAGGYPWPFLGHALIPGRTACAAALDEEQRRRLAEPLARFLAALHATPAEEAAQHGAGPDTIARLDLARRLPRARELLDRLTRRGEIAEPRSLAAILDAAPPTYAPRSDVLVHGDLYARHLLIHPDGRFAGIIDWGDVHLGDPAVDLAIAHTFLPPEAHVSFRRAYGAIEDATWRVARLRGVWHTLLVLEYGLSIGDLHLVRECRLALGHLATAVG
jgi:aminoglycoside phosphotransferase (APT) family kinase protein